MIVTAFIVYSPVASSDPESAAVLVSAAVGILLIGAVVPVAMVRRVRVDVRSPRDVTVGDTVLLDVDLQAVSVAELFAYEPGWGLPGAADRADRVLLP